MSTAVKTTVKKKKKSAKKKVTHAIAHVKATYNNTLVAITDKHGNVLAMSSAGRNGFKGPKKATPYAATMIVKDVVERVADYGVQEVSVRVTGIGQGREAAVRALHGNGLKVVSIKDTTPVAHNGCRMPRPRRV